MINKKKIVFLKFCILKLWLSVTIIEELAVLSRNNRITHSYSPVTVARMVYPHKAKWTTNSKGLSTPLHGLDQLLWQLSYPVTSKLKSEWQILYRLFQIWQLRSKNPSTLMLCPWGENEGSIFSDGLTVEEIMIRLHAILTGWFSFSILAF